MKKNYSSTSAQTWPANYVQKKRDAAARKKQQKEPSPADNHYFYPTICSLVDREAASAIHSLARYVRPQGDWILTRSMLDEIDRGLGEIEQILNHKWNGQEWSKR